MAQYDVLFSYLEKKLLAAKKDFKLQKEEQLQQK